ncbi:thymidylate synthase [Rossellomorea marisflavi]|uniref:thymidylate synthase n=1 Tax=Rossellomorea marisflavi TaxID=189381 RepID=A0A5D4RY61_9BACI|nr:thymidylate synthase [Rossellomorea marisflavi]TYS56323.1 thymidylate synthase [Rossellomorea marisflavi]
MIKADKYFLDNLQEIYNNGVTDTHGKVRPAYKSDGAPAHTKYITFVNESYDLSKNEFPISTLRPLAKKMAIGEILAFYQDQTNDIEVMKSKYNLHWWKDWDVGNNKIGIRYGETVRRYDLLNQLLETLNNDMFSRRKILNLWQEQDFIDDPKGLKPCFYMTNWEVRVIDGDVYLDLHLTSRSSDYSVAGNINRFQYVALQMMIAKHFGFKLGKFSVFTSNLHYYLRHEDQVKELLSRKPSDKQPILKLNVPDGTNFYDIRIDDFELVNFDCDYPQLSFDLGI